MVSTMVFSSNQVIKYQYTVSFWFKYKTLQDNAFSVTWQNGWQARPSHAKLYSLSVSPAIIEENHLLVYSEPIEMRKKNKA